MKITGAVLCGGASNRMGEDKVTLDLLGRPMVQWVVEAMKQAGAETVVALGDRPDLKLPVLADKEPGSGPLGAIIGALEQYGTLLVCPCDIPTVSSEVLREIISHSRVVKEPVVLAHSGRLEPLIGVYKEESLELLKIGYIRGARGPKTALRAEDYATVKVLPDQVKNVNTKEDFRSVLPQFEL